MENDSGCRILFRRCLEGLLPVLLAALLFLAGTVSPAEAGIRSIRTGMQPKGPRIAIDLDESVDYGIVRKDGRLYIQIETTISGAIPQRVGVPRNKLVRACIVHQEGAGTRIEVILQVQDLAFRHYVMNSPARIIVDFFDNDQEPPPFPKPVGLAPLAKTREQKEHTKTYVELLGLLRIADVERSLPEHFQIPLTKKEIVFDKPGIVSGFELAISNGWVIREDCYVELVFSGGLPANSAVPPVDVLLNDYPLEVISVGEVRDGRQNVRYAVGADHLQPGENRLLLLGGKTSVSDPLRIKTESRLVLNSTLRQNLKLSDFPGTFLPEKDKGRTLIVIPQGFSSETYQAGLRLMQILRKENRRHKNKGKIPVSEFVTYPALERKVRSGNDVSGDHIIFLGTLESFDKDVASAFRVPEKLREVEKAFLSCFTNRQGASRLLIGSVKPHVLTSAVERLSGGQLKEKLDKDRILIGVAETETDENGKKELGQKEEFMVPVSEKEILFTGEGRHTYTLNVDGDILPQWMTEIKLGLKVRHSSHLNSRESEIAFIVNGERTEPIALDFGRTGQKMLVVPVHSLGKNRDVDLEMEVLLKAKNMESARNSRLFWCVLDKEATVFFRQSKRPPGILLENISSFLRGQEIEIYAGHSVGPTALNMLNCFFAGLKTFAGKPPDIFVKPLDSYPGRERTSPALIAGSAAEIVQHNIPMAVGYDKDSRSFFPTRSTVPVPEEFQRKSLLLQLFSDRSEDFALLMTWSSGIPWSSGFRETLLDGEIEGTICLVNDEGKTESSFVTLSERPGKGLFTDGGSFVLGFFITAVSLVLFSLIYIFVKRREKW
jgi:hypothetical protein